MRELFLSLESRIECTPLRRIVTAILLGAVLGWVGNWFIVKYLVMPNTPPVAIHSASIETSTVPRSSMLVLRVVTTKYKDCPGSATSWLVDEKFNVFDLPSGRLGIHEVGSKLTTNIRIPIGKRIPPNRYRLVRVLDYECPHIYQRVRFPTNLYFTVVEK